MIQRRGKKKRNDRIFASDSLQSVHEAIRGILPENAVKEALAAEDFFVEVVCGDERQVHWRKKASKPQVGVMA